LRREIATGRGPELGVVETVDPGRIAGRRRRAAAFLAGISSTCLRPSSPKRDATTRCARRLPKMCGKDKGANVTAVMVEPDGTFAAMSNATKPRRMLSVASLVRPTNRCAPTPFEITPVELWYSVLSLLAWISTVVAHALPPARHASHATPTAASERRCRFPWSGRQRWLAFIVIRISARSCGHDSPGTSMAFDPDHTGSSNRGARKGGRWPAS
jgi:hypothetical protein